MNLRILLCPSLFIIFLVPACKQKCTILRNHPLSAFMYVTPNVPEIKLGDTLRVKIFIPYESVRLDNNEVINVINSSISTSGFWLMTYMGLVNGLPEIAENNFKIIPIKGSFARFNHVTVRVTYVRDVDGFVFETYLIPTIKGLAFFSNWKAEGWMNRRCELNIFNPIIGSQNNNHQLLRDFYGPGANDPIPENHYYVWVK